jgi:hypothetical protein
MYSAKSYRLTKEEYNYLNVSALEKKLNENNDKFYVTCLSDELEDMLRRLKGLYDNFDKNFPNSMLIYKCFKMGSINLFRESLNLTVDINGKDIPSHLFLNDMLYTDEIAFINGYNGYTSTKDDGLMCAIINGSAFDDKGKPNLLKNIYGFLIKSTDRSRA